jgi:hypothetical protein
VGNGEITVMMKGAWDANRNKIVSTLGFFIFIGPDNWIFGSGEPGASAK